MQMGAGALGARLDAAVAGLSAAREEDPQVVPPHHPLVAGTERAPEVGEVATTDAQAVGESAAEPSLSEAPTARTKVPAGRAPMRPGSDAPDEARYAPKSRRPAEQLPAGEWALTDEEWEFLTTRYPRRGTPESERTSFQLPAALQRRIDLLDRHMALAPRRGALIRNRLYTQSLESFRPTAGSWRTMAGLARQRDRTSAVVATVPVPVRERLVRLSYEQDPPVPLAHIVAVALTEYLDRISVPPP